MKDKVLNPRLDHFLVPSPVPNKEKARSLEEKMEHETIDVEQDQNEMVFNEEFTEELQEEDGPIPWDLEDQLYEEWREDNGTTEDS